MKKRTRFMVAILCIALLLTLPACAQKEETPSVSAQEEALQRYQQTCAIVAQVPDLTVEVEYALSRIVGGETYSEKMTEIATYRGLGTADAVACVKQQVAFGPYETQYAEYYKNGMAWCKTEDSAFRGKMELQDFLNRHIPAILVDASLYAGVDVDKLFGNTAITFSQPEKLESWATDYAGAVLVSATGTVVLDKDGNLTKSTYTAEFTCDKIAYSLQVAASVKPEVAESLDTDLADLPAKCPALTYFDAPRKILQVVGDVYTAQAMSAAYTESVYSAAFSRSRSQTSSFDTYGAGEDFMAQSSYEVINTDYSNTPVTNSEVVIFRSGNCTSSLNGAEPTVREGITAEAMRTYCEDAVLAALFTPNHLKNAELTEEKNQLRIEFTGNTAFGDNLCSSIYSIFNANLDTYAESYTTPTASGYLCIDKATGLPTALGVKLERVHVAGEISYPLTYQLDQTMQFSAAQAYENITGEPEPTPTEPATNP
ncbi:MAG: hypothetical protein IJZ15_00635 [Oscillospiraceae bacterium]|nr:hypothetical protein [Oscillospiraceae bacterium]